ncbi:hypothetical protein DSO57_1015010 [Entomophthora muscae]|uniref:Uncharacterized protein n=1 Tax=Entomophthora muscae TaxID=34485 RepID=A0ACC2S794_9FUNG|nr:hypothetical protein DSO57_1015010 [Entomophthora muscae]
MIGILHLWSLVTICLSLFLSCILSQKPATLCFPGPCTTPILKLEELAYVAEKGPLHRGELESVLWKHRHILRSGWGLLHRRGKIKSVFFMGDFSACLRRAHVDIVAGEAFIQILLSDKKILGSSRKFPKKVQDLNEFIFHMMSREGYLFSEVWESRPDH